MFRRTAFIATVAVGSLAASAIAHADSHGAAAMDPNVAARQSLMGLMAYNIGVLGGMAQGRMAYESEAASAAAASLYHLSMVDQSRMWPEGTDSMSIDNTRALPALWENIDDAIARQMTLRSAAEDMMNAAGTDLASLQGAIGALGGACGGCHRAYREPDQ